MSILLASSPTIWSAGYYITSGWVYISSDRSLTLVRRVFVSRHRRGVGGGGWDPMMDDGGPVVEPRVVDGQGRRGGVRRTCTEEVKLALVLV
jgi:hypothetical protein